MPPFYTRPCVQQGGFAPTFLIFLGMAMATWWNLHLKFGHLKPPVSVPISGGDNGGDNLFKGLFSIPKLV